MVIQKPKWSCGGGQALFQYLGSIFGLREFIETGVGTGSMIAFMHRVYDRVYSFETDFFKVQMARSLFQFTPNVEIIHEDSAIGLPRLLAEYPQFHDLPTFFWLDAHGQPGKDDGPLTEEINAILKYRPNSLIAIDDVGWEKHHHHNPELQKVKSVVPDIRNWKFDYRFGRILFLHSGQYTLPEDLG